MKLNRTYIVVVLSAALLLCLGGSPAFALWSIADVTANGVYGNAKVTVNITDHEKYKDFEVTFAPQSKRIPAYMDGRLGLIVKNEEAGLISVADKREKGTVTYRFRLTADAFEKSSFDIYVRGRKGDRGGVIYAVKLKAFASPVIH